MQVRQRSTKKGKKVTEKRDAPTDYSECLNEWNLIAEKL